VSGEGGPQGLGDLLCRVGHQVDDPEARQEWRGQAPSEQMTAGFYIAGNLS
jgi:hypothetical protein